MKRLNDKLGLLEHLRAAKLPAARMTTLTMMETAIPCVATMLPLSVPNSTPAAFCVIIVQGDTQLVDIAGNEGHACPGDANDQEIGNGLHKSNHSNGTRDGQKAAENGRSRRHESEDDGRRVPARERNRGAAPFRW